MRQALSQPSTSLRFGLVLAGISVPLVVSVWEIDSPVPMAARVLGATTVICSLIPGLKYLCDSPERRRAVPLLPVVGLIYAIYFGFPFAFGLRERVGASVILKMGPALIMPAALALVGWVVLVIAYWEVGQIVRPKPWDFSRFADQDLLVKAGLVLTALGLLLEIATAGMPVPIEFAALMTFLGRLSWVGMGFLVASWSGGMLNGSQKFLTLAAIVLVSSMEIGTGSVANPGRFWLLLLLAAWIGHGGRVPRRWWVAGIAAVLAMMVLRGSAEQYRQQAWYGADLGAGERVVLYLSIVEDHLRRRGIAAVLKESAETVRDRTSQAAVLADVVRRTPESVPYWSGDTYLSLIGALIPRFLWPSKPVKNVGQRFGHRYSYLHPQDTRTSFNLPFLVEFYANFGVVGVVMGMTLVGLIYRLLDDLLNPSGSQGTVVGKVLALGLLVPVMTAVESDFSLVFGGLILNGLALYAVLRMLTQRRKRHAERWKLTPGRR